MHCNPCVDETQISQCASSFGSTKRSSTTMRTSSNTLASSFHRHFLLAPPIRSRKRNPGLPACFLLSSSRATKALCSCLFTSLEPLLQSVHRECISPSTNFLDVIQVGVNVACSGKKRILCVSPSGCSWAAASARPVYSCRLQSSKKFSILDHPAKSQSRSRNLPRRCGL